MVGPEVGRRDRRAPWGGRRAMAKEPRDEYANDPERIWANLSTVMPSDMELQPSGEFNKADYLKKAAEKFAER